MKWLPNAISVVRIVLVVLYIKLFFIPTGIYMLHSVALAIILGDIADGMAARMLHAESKAGSVLDSLADAFFIVSSFIIFYLGELYSFDTLVLIVLPRFFMGMFYVLFALSKKKWDTRHTIGDKIAGIAYYTAILWILFELPHALTIGLPLLIAVHYGGMILSLRTRYLLHHTTNS